MTWRDKARPIIAAVLRENDGKPLKEIRAALRAAYPFYARLCWPYKVWCDEIRLQLGLKEDKRKKDKLKKKGENLPISPLPGQQYLF